MWKVAEALELPRWTLFRDVNTQEVYYYNYYTNETAMRLIKRNNYESGFVFALSQ